MKKIVFAILALFLPVVAVAQTGQGINVSIPLGGEGGQIATPIKIALVLTFLTFLPALMVSCTSFTRIIVVFSFLRQAMGLQSSPPNQVMVGLALFMTFAVMSPTFQEMHKRGFGPYLDGALTEKQAVTEALDPLRQFMWKQTRNSDLDLMLGISGIQEIASFEELPTTVLVPAFILSELKTSFEIGFMVYIPFVVIDMVVSMILLAMGMMVLPPVVISMPFKIILFVLVDGWGLVVKSLMESFRTG